MLAETFWYGSSILFNAVLFLAGAYFLRSLLK